MICAIIYVHLISAVYILRSCCYLIFSKSGLAAGSTSTSGSLCNARPMYTGWKVVQWSFGEVASCWVMLHQQIAHNWLYADIYLNNELQVITYALIKKVSYTQDIELLPIYPAIIKYSTTVNLTTIIKTLHTSIWSN